MVDVGSFNLADPFLPPFIVSFLILVFGESSVMITSTKMHIKIKTIPFTNKVENVITYKQLK